MTPCMPFCTEMLEGTKTKRESRGGKPWYEARPNMLTKMETVSNLPEQSQAKLFNQRDYEFEESVDENTGYEQTRPKAMTKYRHQTRRRWPITASEKRGNDKIPPPNKKTITKYRHQTTRRWKLTANKQKGDDQISPQNNEAMTKYRHQTRRQWPNAFPKQWGDDKTPPKKHKAMTKYYTQTKRRRKIPPWDKDNDKYRHRSVRRWQYAATKREGDDEISPPSK